MELYEFVQTTGAFSGLLCLTVVILSAKKQLKAYSIRLAGTDAI